MARTRASARGAGTRFERVIADYLAGCLDDDRIDRRVKTGAKDRGDIGGVRIHGQRLVLEVKDCARTDLAGWMTECEIQRGNDDALAGVVISKRHGRGHPGDQWVHCTVNTLIALISGQQVPDGR
jgi:hypothetical protein